MLVFSCSLRVNGNLVQGYIIAESMEKALEIAPGRMIHCSEMGQLIVQQGTIEAQVSSSKVSIFKRGK